MIEYEGNYNMTLTNAEMVCLLFQNGQLAESGAALKSTAKKIKRIAVEMLIFHPFLSYG